MVERKREKAEGREGRKESKSGKQRERGRQEWRTEEIKFSKESEDQIIEIPSLKVESTN